MDKSGSLISVSMQSSSPKTWFLVKHLKGWLNKEWKNGKIEIDRPQVIFLNNILQLINIGWKNGKTEIDRP